jgi:hypothetical protein
MKPRERRSPSRQVAASAEDGLDDKIWELLRGFIATVGRGDASGARSAIPRLEHDLPNDGQAAAYIWYLLRYRVVEILERKPASEDLHELATSTWPGFAAIVHGDEQLVEDVLSSVFNHAPAEDEITEAVVPDQVRSTGADRIGVRGSSRNRCPIARAVSRHLGLSGLPGI